MLHGTITPFVLGACPAEPGTQRSVPRVRGGAGGVDGPSTACGVASAAAGERPREAAGVDTVPAGRRTGRPRPVPAQRKYAMPIRPRSWPFVARTRHMGHGGGSRTLAESQPETRGQPGRVHTAGTQDTAASPI